MATKITEYNENINVKETTNIEVVNVGASLSVASMWVGADHTCALLSDGSVKCWGWNDRGQLGLGKVSTSVGGIPAETPDKLPAVQIFAP